MTLLDFVQSLQEQGATDIPAKVQEWKKKNQPKVEEEKVKQLGAVKKTDASASPKTSDASNMEFGSADGFSEDTIVLPEVVVTAPSATENIILNNSNWDNLYQPNTIEGRILYNQFLQDLFKDDENIIIPESQLTPTPEPVSTNIVSDIFGVTEDAIRDIFTTRDDFNNEEDTWKEDESLYNSSFTLGDLFGVEKDRPSGPSNLVVSYSGEKVESTTDKKLQGINMPRLRRRFIDIKTEEEFNRRLKTKSKDNIILDVIENGKVFNTEADKKLIDLQNRFDKVPDNFELKKEISKDIEKLVNDENYGSRRLYDPYSGNIIDFNQASPDLLDIYEDAKQVASTTEVDKLKEDLARKHAELVAISKGIKDTSSKDFSKSMSLATVAVGGIKSLFGDETTISSDIKFINEIAETGKIPKKITKLPGNSPYAKDFNKSLEEYLILNRAYQINRNPITSKKEKGLEGFSMSAFERIMDMNPSSVSTPVSQSKQTQVFADVMSSTGAVYLNPKELNERIGLNMSQMVGGGLVDLSLFAGEIFATRKLSFNAISKGINAITKMGLSTKILKKSKIAKNVFPVVMKGVDESATFVLGGELFRRPTLEENLATTKFAFNLGIGQGAASLLLKNVPTFKIFSPALAALNKRATTRNWLPSITGAGIGAASFEFASAVDGLIKNGELSKDFMYKTNYDGSLTKKSTMDHMKHFLGEYYKMRLLGAKSVFAKNGLVRGFRNDIREFRGLTSTETSQAASKVNWKDLNSIKNPNENTIKELNDSKTDQLENVAVEMNEGLLTELKGLKKIKDIKDNFDLLNTQVELNIAKESIKAEENSAYYITDAMIYVAVNRLKKGEKLTAEDSYVLDNTPTALLKDRSRIPTSTNEDEKSLNTYFENVKMRSAIIEQILNENPLLKTPFGDPLRQKAFEFINESFNQGSRITELENIKNKTTQEKTELKELIDLHKTYEFGGEEFIKITDQVKALQEKLFREDVGEEGQFEGEQELISTKENFQKKYDELYPNKPKNVLEDQAFFDPTSKVRFINEIASLEQGATSVNTHERAHFAFVNNYKDAEGKITKKGIEIIDKVLEKLTPKQKEILDTEVESRYDTTKDKSNWYEEKLAVLAELSRDKKIVVKKSFRENLADKLNLEKAGIKVSLETGDGIFEMLTKESGLDRAKIIDAEKTTITKTPSFSLSREKSNKANDIYNKKGEAGLMEIVDLMKETADGLARSFRDRPKYEAFKKILAEEILSGERGIMEVAMGYPAYVKSKEAKGEKPAPISGYLNNSFSTKTGFKRYIEIADRVLGKGDQSKFTQEITDNIAETTKADKTETKTDVLAKKPTETTKFNKNYLSENFKKSNDTSKEAIENKITEVITEGYKDRDVTSFRDAGSPKFPVPRLVAEFYADMFGIKTIDGLTKKSQNFYPRDRDGLRNLQKFLIENALSDFNRLPKTVSDTGKSTGILSTKLGKVMYNDIGKLVGTVKQYRDIIQGKNITLTIQNGKNKGKSIEFNIGKDISRGDLQQNLKTAFDFHVKNRALEVKIPEQGKRIQLGAKFAAKKSGQDKLDEISGVLSGTVSKNTEERIKFYTKQLPKFLPAQQFIRPTNLTSGVKLSTIEKRMFNFLSDINKIKDPKSRKEALLKLETGVLADVTAVKKQALKNEKQFSEDEILKYKEAVRVKNGIDYNKNAKRQELHNEGVSLTIDALIDMYSSGGVNDKAIIRELLYNPNLNSNFNRNMATAIGREKGVEDGKGNSTDEHVFQAIENAKALLEIGNIKDATIRNNSKKYYKEWIKDNYVQFTLKDITDIVKGNLTDSEGNIWENSGGTSHPLLIKLLYKAIKSGKKSDWDNVPSSKIRYFNEFVNLNPNNLFTYKWIDGKVKEISVAKEYNVEVPKIFEQNPMVAKYQSKLIYEQELTKSGILKESEAVSSKQAKQRIKEFLLVEPSKREAMFSNSKNFGDKVKNLKTIEDQVNTLKNYDEAAKKARSLNTKEKGISVFDFDDTLAKSKSKVLYEMPDGKTGKLTATEFAKRSEDLESKGAIFDFTEFNKVVEGKKGPLADLALKRQGKFGSKDIFVLTARPQASAQSIKNFLDGIGLNLPLKNITGLEDGAPSAKGNWVASKAAEGYNNFYFADDALKNVKAVKEVLDQIDVKSKVQQAKFSKQKTFDKIFNNIIESSTGIESYKEFSKAKAETIGAKKGKFSFLTTPSAEDFLGLLYKTLGKGKVGDSQIDFYQKNLIDPYNRAEISVTQAKISAANDFKALKKDLKTLPKSLSKQTGIGGFTFSQAARVAIWTKQGMNIPGLSLKDSKQLNDFIAKNAELSVFVDQLMDIQKGKPYPKPGKNWLAGTVTSDIINEINKVNRKEYLQEWQENVDIIFSDKNMNKLEAAYGSKYREALEDQLRRMKSGSNRPIGGSRIVDNLMDWLNNSVGAVMFLNTKSAVLQTISSVNFLNLKDNNILSAGKAFANQKQYWKDFMTLMNSPYLVERRDGLKINVSESEIADAVAESSNKPKAALAYLLNKGFIMTRFADSFAIAAGGSTFYRNRINTLVKQGLDLKSAEKQAFEDFYSIAETSQQSSNASKISQQQASAAGRVILAFGNTPMQYNRIIKRSTQDLIAGRGDWKTNISKILYYGAIQNLAFNALQNALFAEAFNEEEDEDNKKSDKAGRIANGMADSLIRGFGVQGAVSVAVKDALTTIYKENNKDKGSPKFDKAIYDLFGFSPPLDAKVRKLKSASNTFSWNRKEIKEEGFNLNNPAYLASAQIVSAITNVPLDRAIKKINNLRNITSEETQNWQKVALAMGWTTWDVGLPFYGVKQKVKMTPQMILKEKVVKMKKETSTKQQKETLLKLGLTKQQIKALRYEEARVKKIIELQEKKDGKN